MAYNIIKSTQASTLKKVVYIAAVIVCILIINGLIHSIYDLWKKQDLVEAAKQELVAEKQKNQELAAQLVYVKSDEFIEEEARNKLFMVRPGESDVIVPEELIRKKEEKKVIIVPAWQQWINLFIGKN